MRAAPIGLTMGDPSGIGLDLSLKAWSRRKELDLPTFVYIGDIDAINARASLLGLDVKVKETSLDDAADNFDQFIPAIEIKALEDVIPGQPNSANAPAVIGAIDQAVQLAKSGQISAVVTNPIAKSVLYAAGFKHPGHTEYLASLSKDAQGNEPLPVMMLAGPQLRTVPVTIHIPLMSIMEYLTTELIVKTCQITAQDLSQRYGIKNPRLAISGLNPHAGEDGALGHEDAKYIAPAIVQLQAMGIDATGPLPADTMFHEDARCNYDVAICMYHDQALIPAKALGFHDAVNVTLGLPFIRTSPDHGTAFSIAGQNIAREDSLVAAIKMAGEMVQFNAQKEN